MVISDLHKFIFLRIPKNASTSLATFFVQNCCGPDAIYTGIGDSKVPTQNVPAHIRTKYSHQYRFIHLTLNEIIDEGVIDAQSARQHRAMGVIRNPLERQLSLFFFKHRNNQPAITPSGFRTEFREGCHYNDGSNKILQSDYLKIGDERHGEFWKYENINEHLEAFVEENGIKVTHPLATYKSKIKPKNENLIAEFYDDVTRQAVEDYYKEDMDIYERL